MNIQRKIILALSLSGGFAMTAVAADDTLQAAWAGPAWYETSRAVYGIPLRFDGPYSTNDACAANLRSYLMKPGRVNDLDLDCEYWRNETDEPTS